MKPALVAVLVAFVVFTGIPLPMGMPAADCVDCGLGILVAGACVIAVLTALVAIAPALLAVRLRLGAALLSSALATSGLYRPPRLA